MGLAWLLAIWALDIKTPWRDRDDTHLFILAWFVSYFVLIYIPLNFQIHLLSGWQVVIGVLATIALYRRVLPWLQKRLPNMSPKRLALIVSAALLLVVIPTNVYILAWRFVDLRRYDYPFYVEKNNLAALDYLETQVKSDDVVLSSLTLGQYIPALTGARAFLAHWAQTLDFYGKDALVKAFFTDTTTDAQRLDILKKYGVDYVIFSNQERDLDTAKANGGYDPSQSPFLTDVYHNDLATVYKVDADAVSLR
jgi:hypothetical protein